MGEERGVEIDAVQPDLLGERHPRFEIFGGIFVPVHLALVRAEDRVTGVKIQTLFAGNQRKRLFDVLFEFFEISRPAGIVARDLQTVAQSARPVESHDVVTLPAMDADGNGFEFFERAFDVYAEFCVFSLCLFKNRTHGSLLNVKIHVIKLFFRVTEISYARCLKLYIFFCILSLLFALFFIFFEENRIVDNFAAIQSIFNHIQSYSITYSHFNCKIKRFMIQYHA